LEPSAPPALDNQPVCLPAGNSASSAEQIDSSQFTSSGLGRGCSLFISGDSSSSLAEMAGLWAAGELGPGKSTGWATVLVRSVLLFEAVLAQQSSSTRSKHAAPKGSFPIGRPERLLMVKMFNKFPLSQTTGALIF